jgi:hypothetical protein
MVAPPASADPSKPWPPHPDAGNSVVGRHVPGAGSDSVTGSQEALQFVPETTQNVANQQFFNIAFILPTCNVCNLSSKFDIRSSTASCRVDMSDTIS